ncbi:MAG: nucleotide sugar dehydrogenase [Methanofollis liminatans]|uniref:UDP-N-acetyl-D-mannosamine dehydrogenase n=1 Tax=Methanofollis liminatans DSM 4140 TaxID=28892 RepID=J1L085_9EURY|nr:nucleotide sugar dehydrogenase [Methanofollis liminatans]EJG06025.1 nucleotide sugar dehydrogenase [Methanofollis liminatans DSM 4140]MDD3111590.1 nucleotide sugar dehydrogenase [Methanofollis liminatans]
MVHVPDDIRDKTVCVVGLGYVGFPLAEAFSRHIKTIGYDVDGAKIASLKNKNDAIAFTTDPSLIREADFVLICVPTPVKKSREPDLYYVESAASTVGKNLKPGAVVVLESTVYPGVTEDLVCRILEKESGLRCGVDFKIGYSPERINPGDEAHSLDRITKIVSGMDEETTNALSALYGLITTVYRAKDIRTAEGAKVIENIQRDLNIALMNELTIIFHKMNMDTQAVLEAASTKWNFIRFNPGLVGGHCIPVDPYYLVYKAKELGYHPQVILAGRAINDHMAEYVADMAIRGLNDVGKVIKGSDALIMGLTYKEDVPDTRESPVREVVQELKSFGVNVYGYDPLLSRREVEAFGVRALDEMEGKFDCVIAAVAHEQFRKMTVQDLSTYLNGRSVLIDLKGLFHENDPDMPKVYYRRL